MSNINDLMDDFEDEDENAVEVENSHELLALTKKKQNQRKVDIRRLIEERKEFSALFDEKYYLMNLDLESDTPLI